MNRVVGGASVGSRTGTRRTASAVATTSASAATSSGTGRCHSRSDWTVSDVTGAALVISNLPASARRTSPMSRSRSFGSLTRHRRTTERTCCGTSAPMLETSGSFTSTEASISDTSPASNSRLPVSISNSTAPNAQMSARRSTGCPLACSGAM